MKADAVKCRPFTCVSCQVPQFCLSASRSLWRLIPKSKSRENAVYRYKAIVVNTPYRKNTLSQKVLASCMTEDSTDLEFHSKLRVPWWTPSFRRLRTPALVNWIWWLFSPANVLPAVFTTIIWITYNLDGLVFFPIWYKILYMYRIL